jgi:PAS domain S-box-containing protein
VSRVADTAHDLTGHLPANDVSRTHLQQQAIAELSNHRLQSILDSMFVFVGLFSLDGVVLEINRAAIEAGALERVDVLGKLLPDTYWWCYSPAVQDRLRAALERAARGEVVRYDEIVRVANDQRLTIDVTFGPLRDAQGTTAQIVGSAVDITERKRFEHQYLRAQRLESLGTLAGGIAHDLNNVLTPIMMSIELLTMDETNKDRLEVLATIRSSARRGANMVKQVLSFARGVEGRHLDVQVTHLLRDVAKIANDTFLKSIQVSTIIPDDLRTVSGDPTQLEQVLLNLCVNARDAMPEGGSLTLSAENVILGEHDALLNPEEKAGAYVIILVEDNGIGMPQSIIDKIFDPFFTTKELGKGTGLGLSTSLGIVKSHGGFIRVRSEPGQGTTFAVYLPALAESQSAAEILEEPELPRGHGELILVVDDEAALRQVTRRTLERFGYRAIGAADGAGALAMYASQYETIAVVLTDMMMPAMDGSAIIQGLMKIRADVRIIAASGLSANGAVARGAGAKHFLPKPYTTPTLLKALRRVLLGQPPASSV